jgi:ribosomal-protein-alanine N-acetyltransferase
VSELTENIYAHYVVVKQEGKVVAYSGMWVIVDEAHITNIAVHPHYRRRGIGEMLMKEMLERAKSHGALRMTLEVRVSNKTAQDLYIRLGFIATGIRRGYYSDTGEDATVMWLNDLGPGRVVDEGVRYE